MKTLTLSLLLLIAANSCKKHIDKKEEPDNNISYGNVAEVNLIELTANDTLDLNNRENKYHFIVKYIFYKEIFGYDEVKDSLYSNGYVRIGTLLRDYNAFYTIEVNGVYQPTIAFQLIDTAKIISRDSTSITYGINENLIGNVVFNIYDEKVNKLFMLLKVSPLGIVKVRVTYKGTQNAKEVAGYINNYYLKTYGTFQWIP